MRPSRNVPGLDPHADVITAAGHVARSGSAIRLAIACLRTGRPREALAVLEELERDRQDGGRLKNPARVALVPRQPEHLSSVAWTSTTD